MFIPEELHHLLPASELSSLYAHGAEQHIRKRRGARQWNEAFRLENKIDLYSLIKFCLKLSGFWIVVTILISKCCKRCD